MFFRNIWANTLTPEDLDLDKGTARLNARLLQRRYVPPAAAEEHSQGFAPPFDPDSDQFLVNFGSAYFFSMIFASKRITRSMAQRELAKRVARLQSQLGKKLSKQEVREQREALRLELLPKILPDEKRYFGYIDLRNKYLVIDASPDAAEAVLSALRDAEPNLHTVAVAPPIDMRPVMTNWITNSMAPTPFELDDSCDLRHDDTKATVRARKHDLASDEIHHHVEEGQKQAIGIGLRWSDKLTFVLTDKFHVRMVRRTDSLEQMIKEQSEADASVFDTEVAARIMVDEFPQLLNDLVNAVDHGNFADDDET